MRALFAFGWLALLAVMAATVPLLGPLVGDPGKAMGRNGYLLLMGSQALLVPALVVLLPAWAARRRPSLINLPHREHWFAEPQRAATVAWLDRWFAAVGLWTVAVFALIHQRALEQASSGWPALPSPLWPAAVVSMALAFVVLMWRYLRRFKRPAQDR